MEVSPKVIKGYWKGAEGKLECFCEIPTSQMVQTMIRELEKFNPRLIEDGPQLTPPSRVGLLVDKSTASFRRVVLEVFGPDP